MMYGGHDDDIFLHSVPKNWEEVGMDLLEHGQNAYNPRQQDAGLSLETGGKHHGARLENMDWSEHMPNHFAKLDSSNSAKRPSKDLHVSPLLRGMTCPFFYGSSCFFACVDACVL